MVKIGYMKIANLYKEQDILLFRKCFSLEKIHGCLQSNVNVLLPNGKRKHISQIQKGEYVLGMNECNQVVQTKVINTFNNGITGDWLKVVGTRFAAGRGGNGKFCIRCTPNHKFYLPSKKRYIKASKLQKGDEVSCIRIDRGLNPIQKQVLLGKMLGDGYLNLTSISGKVEWRHKEEHTEYVLWTARGLSTLSNPKVQRVVSGYGTQMRAMQTLPNFFVKDYLESFIKNGKKIVPKWVCDKLTPIALAFWYMDDGSLGHGDSGTQENTAQFAVCSFTREDCDTLITGLKKFNINATYYTSESNHSRLRLNADDAEKLFLLITPYIPKCMQYKLPKRYRGHDAWLPSINSGYKSDITLQRVESVQQEPRKNFHKYDLETDTHNFFANEILVHNSSAHISFDGINNLRFFSGGAKHENFVKLFDPDSLLTIFKENFNYEVTVYGEAYGGKINGMRNTYGPDLQFVAFDVRIRKNWLSVPKAETIAKLLGLDFVDYNLIPTTLEAIDIERDKDSTQAIRNGMGTGKLREGIVLRPVVELTTNNGRRVICKHKRDEFRETRTPRLVSKEELKVLDDAQAVADEWVVPERLKHVLSKADYEVDIVNMGKIIKDMIADIYLEGDKEIVKSKATERAIGKRTVFVFKGYLMDKAKG